MGDVYRIPGGEAKSRLTGSGTVRLTEILPGFMHAAWNRKRASRSRSKQGALSVVATSEVGSLALRNERLARFDLYWRERSWPLRQVASSLPAIVVIVGLLMYLVPDRDVVCYFPSGERLRRGLWEGFVGRTTIDGFQYGEHYAITVLQDGRLPERRVIQFSEALDQTTVEVRMKPGAHRSRYCRLMKPYPSPDAAEFGSLTFDVEPAGARMWIERVEADDVESHAPQVY